ncbi:MAG: recombinase family protein [Rhodospirillales bacterium]|nr:recombinase family protein [Rhodospirillales bacterium]
MKAPVRKVRCAIYTRKSSEEGLEMEFNSLDAQREAGLAYIQSQKSEGWILVGDRYDDGGFSGGTMERPELKRLLRDVEAGAVDVIVVYKVDRLSRSLGDFARIVEVFDRHDVSFVSVTQAFNTTTSMGRLTLNILLSFAQFEREVIGERIRDKFAASRARGMWMGGIPPLGYDVVDRKLVVNETEADLVRLVFDRFLRLGSATKLAQELRRAGHTTKSWTTQDGKSRPGKPIDKGAIYKILGNRTYLGEAVHKGTSHPGEHQAIIDQGTWDKVHAVLADNRVARGNGTRAQTPSLLRGLIFAPGGHAMTPSHTRKSGKLYRYYLATDAIRQGYADCPVRSVPAAEVEEAVVAQVRHLLRTPEIIARTWSATKREGDEPIPEREVVKAITDFAPLWDELFPAEQARIVRLLVERIDLSAEDMRVRLRTDGLQTLVEELRSRKAKAA